jgi:hypothetical protein
MYRCLNTYCLYDNDKKVFDYFIGWIAMMIQKPEVKTTCNTLISALRKRHLMQLFAKMLGESKNIEYKFQEMSNTNGIMADAFS